MKLRIGGCDPGFAFLAFSIIDLFVLGGSELIATKLVTTQPASGKSKNIEDEVRRLAEIGDAFIEFLDEHQPDVMIIEEPGKCLMKRNGRWVTNGSRLRTACLAWGAIHGICRARGILCIQVYSQAMKKEICGKKNASKQEMIEAIKARYPGYDGWVKTKKIEHEADSVAAAITGFRNPVVMVLLRKLRTMV